MNEHAPRDYTGPDPGEPGPCPSCGHERVSTEYVDQTFTYGDAPDAPQLSARVPLRTCAACGFQFLDAEAQDAQHAAVCHHLGVLTPSQIRDLRTKRCALSRAEFARITKIGEATLARWERGALIQNRAYDRYLRLLAFDDNVQRLRDWGDSPDESLAPRSPLEPRFRAMKPTPKQRECAANFQLHRVAA